MPPSGGISKRLVDVLDKLDKRLSGGDHGGVGSLAAAGAVGFAAARFHDVMNAQPTSMGTLGTNIGLLTSSIGADQTAVRNTMDLAAAVNNVRNAWNDASRSAKDYVINTGAMGAGLFAASRMGAPVGAMLSAGFGTIGSGGAGSFAGGFGTLAMGHASEALIGRNLASSALQVAGAGQLFNAASGMGRLTRGTAGGLVAAEIWNALPEDSHGKTAFGIRNSNFASELGVSSSEMLQAAQRAGVMRRNGDFQRDGVMGALENAAVGLYDMMRPWSDEEKAAVTANRNGVRGPMGTLEGRRARNRLDNASFMMEMNFESKQFGVDQLHGIVQQQAVRTPAQQEQMRIAMEEFTNALQDWIRRTTPNNAGGGAAPN